MSVKIRLQRKGRKKRPYYHIVVANSRSKRDGRYIERIGSYNPLTNPATITLDNDKAFEWLMKGAQPSYTARAILRFKGVLYRKHLDRGVKKGALTEEQAKNLYEEFMAAKNEKVQARIDKEAAEKKDKMSAMLAAPEVEQAQTEENLGEPQEENAASESEAKAEDSSEGNAATQEQKEDKPEADAEEEKKDVEPSPEADKKEEEE